MGRGQPPVSFKANYLAPPAPDSVDKEPRLCDSREFWQRAEERNMATAKLYDALGLPEYHAIEAFARWPLARAANAAAQLEKD